MESIYSSYAEVVPKIFIGDHFAAKNMEFIARNNITFIVCASNDANDINPRIETVFVKDIPDSDFVNVGNVPMTSMITTFNTKRKVNIAAAVVHKKYKQIAEQKTRENILIHCKAGVNRSALIIGMFMIKYLGMTYDDAVGKLEDANHRRNMMLPALTNQTFRAILASE